MSFKDRLSRSPAAARGRGASGVIQNKNNAPMVEIFGGMFALMLALFLIINLLTQAALRERLEEARSEGLYRINWDNGSSGYIVIAFPQNLRIIENGQAVASENICAPNSPFIEYALRVYTQQRQQIVFVILENSIPTMRIARDCLANTLRGQLVTIAWIIADRELLKSVSLKDMPPYIEHIIENP